MKLQSKLGLASAVAAALLLAACGDSDSGDNTPPITSEVPASAGNSPQDFMAAVRAIVAADADLLEPSDISAIAASTTTGSETDLPEDVAL